MGDENGEQFGMRTQVITPRWLSLGKVPEVVIAERKCGKYRDA